MLRKSNQEDNRYIYTYSTKNRQVIANTRRLFEAMEYGDEKSAQMCLIRDIDLEAKRQISISANGLSLLQVAISKDMTQVALDLIKRGIDLSCASNNPQNGYLAKAVFHQQEDVAIALMNKQPNLYPSNVLFSPLVYSAYCGYDKLISTFLKHGVDVNEQDSNGTTPLIMAVSAGKFPTARLLIDSGADLSVKNGKGKDALQVALKGYKEADKRCVTTKMISLLIENGAEIDWNKVSAYQVPVELIENAQNKWYKKLRVKLQALAATAEIWEKMSTEDLTAVARIVSRSAGIRSIRQVNVHQDHSYAE